MIGPKILGQATDLIFAGVIGRQLPAGHHRGAGRRRPRGRGRRQRRRPAARASTSSRARASTSPRSATCCSGRSALYVGASLFSWLQGYLLNGVVQRTVLPAARRRRGQAAPAAAALLRPAAARRAAQPGHQRHRQRRRRRLQQTMSQLLTSLLTVVGVLAMMFVISPLLALIALVTVPLSMLVTTRDRQAVAEAVRRAVGAHRRAERAHRGGVHRARAGQGVRPPARGRGARSREQQRGAVRRPASARSSSPGIIMPAMMFIGNLNYVADRRRRRPAGGLRRR